MKYIILIIHLFFFNPKIYSSPFSSEIREYQFGEKYSYVLHQELQKKEYTLMTSRTNQQQLVFRGILFNKPMNVIYHFRQSRLASLSYLWQQEQEDFLWQRSILYLLKQKYGEPSTKNITAQESTVEIHSYTSFTTNKIDDQVIISPVLQITLENIILSNSKQTLILEYQSYDSDALIKQKILLEDL